MNRQRSFCKAEKGNNEVNEQELSQKLQNILFMKIDLYLKTLTINIEKFLTFKVDLNSSGAKALIKQDDESQKSGHKNGGTIVTLPLFQTWCQNTLSSFNKFESIVLEKKKKLNNILMTMVDVGIYILYFLKFATSVQGIFFDLFDIISDNKTFVGKVFNKIEEKTGRNRCEAATLLASVITVLLLFSKSAELLCNSICFAYPAVKSLEKLH
ncbi:hypothetical protein T09_11289 [Trichinella sp. T9]|nr:hypothetical protein T09_11289 [Trichinella sp. T9]